MCFFFKRRKLRKQQEALKRQQEEFEAEKKRRDIEITHELETKVNKEPEEKPVKKEEPAEKEEPKKEEVKILAAKKTPSSSNRYTGKYEIYPEAGMFKFRLKASNGEILIVSNAYTSIEGATAGIETTKKNIKIDNSSIITDKSGFSQFKFMTANGARVVVSGEYYNNLSAAQSALESAKKFALTAKTAVLESIPASEIREEKITLKPLDKKPNGKLEIFSENKQFSGRLIASNGEVLFVTEEYTAKTSLIKGLANIKEKISSSYFTICRDKQDRYQFKLYSTNGQQLLVGQTYPSKDSALSAIDSVRRFIDDAKEIDLTVKPKKAEKKPVVKKTPIKKAATKKAPAKKTK